MNIEKLAAALTALLSALTFTASGLAREHDPTSEGPIRAPAAWGRGSAIELVERAGRAEQRGDAYAALRLYGEAVQLDPTYGPAHLAYGKLRERLNDFSEAEYLYGLAIRFQDTTVEALAARASVRRKLGRNAEALRDLERATELSMDLHHVETLAAWYAELSAWPAALAVFRRLSNIVDPSSVETRHAVEVRLRALTVLAAECDPATAGRSDASWVRRALARVAVSGPL